MGLVDKFKGMFVSLDDDYEEDEQEFVMERPSAPREESAVRRPVREEYEADEESRRRGNKIVNIHATTQLQMILVKPENFEDASAIADHLNARRAVVLNLENASKELSRRLVDFLSGVAYANNGQIKRVANNAFMITPANVEIQGDLIDELENNGVYF
ncbi:MAG: cell division protein SepF [Oscillospiraceae bacterium]|jgi:cell division inhibitor SepF|nr:cell division protein SepF [Oscillospiraceae bacterium]